MTIKQIQKSFGYRLQGSARMKKLVIQTVSLLSDEQISFLTKRCWFVSSMEDSWAFALRGDDLGKGNSLIFLSDELLVEPDFEVQYTIAHEIGHIILGHKNRIGVLQSKSEVKKQEVQADAFAKKVLEDFFRESNHREQ